MNNTTAQYFLLVTFLYSASCTIESPAEIAARHDLSYTEAALGRMYEDRGVEITQALKDMRQVSSIERGLTGE